MYHRKKKNSIDPKKLIFGRHPVMDALDAGTNLDKIMLSAAVKGPFEKELRSKCKTANIPLYIVQKERLNFITQKNHQGVLGFIAEITYQEIEHVYPLIFEGGETPLLLMLDGVTDVRNMGAIARSALASGAHALIVPQKGTAQINAEAIKSSAGALTKIPVCRTSSLENALDYLIENGVQVVSADLSGKKYLQSLDLSLPTVILLGSEDEGIRPHLLRKSTEIFKIPMKGEMDSFNVSVAAGIVLYESLRQREITDGGYSMEI